MKKEWAQLKWGLVFYIFINNLILFWGKDHLVIGLPEDLFASVQPMIGLCFILHLVMAVTLLFDSLGKDMGHPALWLHSSASMRQLVGAKFLLISLAVGCSLLIYGMISGISYYTGGGDVSVADNLLLSLSVYAVIMLNAIYVMAIVFFFWSIYQVFRSRIGLFSIVVIIILVNIWLIGWGFVWFTEVFQTVKEMVPMYGSIQDMDLLMFNNYIVPGGTILTIGSLILYGLLTVFYFVFGTILFEKKVRL